jgi:hypothetical protein
LFAGAAGDRVNSAGIDDIESHTIPFGFGHQPVTRRTGHFVHHRQPLASQAVEQGAFTDIRTPNQGYNRFWHSIFLKVLVWG